MTTWNRCEHTIGTEDGRIRQCIKDAGHGEDAFSNHLYATIINSAMEMTCVATTGRR